MHNKLQKAFVQKLAWKIARWKYYLTFIILLNDHIYHK